MHTQRLVSHSIAPMKENTMKKTLTLLPLLMTLVPLAALADGPFPPIKHASLYLGQGFTKRVLTYSTCAFGKQVARVIESTPELTFSKPNIETQSEDRDLKAREVRVTYIATSRFQLLDEMTSVIPSQTKECVGAEYMSTIGLAGQFTVSAVYTLEATSLAKFVAELTAANPDLKCLDQMNLSRFGVNGVRYEIKTSWAADQEQFSQTFTRLPLGELYHYAEVTLDERYSSQCMAQLAESSLKSSLNTIGNYPDMSIHDMIISYSLSPVSTTVPVVPAPPAVAIP